MEGILDWSTEWSTGDEASIDHKWMNEIPWESGIIALTKTEAKGLGLPESQPFPWDQEDKGIYVVNAHHVLHCVVSYSNAYIRRSIDHPISLPNCLSTRRTDERFLCSATCISHSKNTGRINRKAPRIPMSSIASILFVVRRCVRPMITCVGSHLMAFRGFDLVIDKNANVVTGPSFSNLSRTMMLVTSMYVQGMTRYRIFTDSNTVQMTLSIFRR